MSNDLKNIIIDELSKLDKAISHLETQIGLLELSYYEYIGNPDRSSEDLNVFTGRHSMLLEYMQETSEELRKVLKYLNEVLSGLEDKLSVS